MKTEPTTPEADVNTLATADHQTILVLIEKNLEVVNILELLLCFYCIFLTTGQSELFLFKPSALIW